MKRLFSIISIVIVLLAIPFSIPVFATSNISSLDVRNNEANSFNYIDNDSGVTFTVPANWKQAELSKDREYIDVKFASTEEDGCIILYGSADLWEQMSAADKIGVTRSDLSSANITKSDIAEMYGVSEDKVSTVTYNGIQYFKWEMNITTDLFGVDLGVSMTMLFYIDNGWMYMFEFSGTNTHKLYADFESLLESVKYPTASNVGLTNVPSNNSNNSGIIAVVILLIVVAVIVIALVLSHKKNCETTNYTHVSTPYPTVKADPVIYCTNCGQALPLDSDFCHKCGAKILKGGK